MNQIMHTPSTASIEALEIANRVGDSSVIVSESEVQGPTVGIMFGRERAGLTNEELALADSTIYIPAFESYSVLNLAQAVNIIGYEMFKRQLELTDQVRNGGVLSIRTTDRLANREELDRFFTRLRKHLLDRNYKAISKNNDEKNDIKNALKDAKLSKNDDRLGQILDDAVSFIDDDENLVDADGTWMSATQIRNQTNGEDYYRELKFRSLQAIFRRVSTYVILHNHIY
jgi:tRNA C32,U32 (ribose-2'-O)-methylase TrmJ